MPNSSKTGQDVARKTGNGKAHTLAFNSRHLSQAIPTRWRFIVMIFVLKSGRRGTAMLARGKENYEVVDLPFRKSN
jgi:hypothetical protein